MLGWWSFLFLGLVVGLVVIIDGWVALLHMVMGAALYVLFHAYRTCQQVQALQKKIKEMEKEIEEDTKP